MKKISILLAAVLLTLALCGTIYAKYIKGFVVVNTTSDTVIIKDKDNIEISVITKKPGKFKIGDKVKYDEKKNKLRAEVRQNYGGGC